MCADTPNPIEQDIEESLSEAQAASEPIGEVARIARAYDDQSDRLLGFVLNLNYNEIRIVTCDPWKRKCGGVPRNSFVIVKISPKQVDKSDYIFCDRIILARITDSVPTPVESDLQGTIYQIHKVQAILDPVTQKELQWSALKANIVGTYFDSGEGLSFGNDVDTFFAPHAYEVYVPSPEDLTLLINSFVKNEDGLEIGRLRYTETPTFVSEPSVPVLVDPLDFVGRENGHRTALFGKTRFGKSNTIKVIADTILSSGIDAGQIIFDPSGEYTYWNEQDDTCIYVLHSENSVRYSLNPRSIHQEQQQGIEPPHALRVNFYEQVVVGHSLFVSTYNEFHTGQRPNYMIPLLDWTPFNPGDIPNRRTDARSHWRMWRTLGLWYAALHRAGFRAPANLNITINLSDPIKTSLAQAGVNFNTQRNNRGEEVFSHTQPINLLPGILEHVAQLYRRLSSAANRQNSTLTDQQAFASHFPPSSDGDPYYGRLEETLLTEIVAPQPGRTGYTYLTPFQRFHDPQGGDLFNEISAHAQAGRTVLLDFAQSDEQTRRVLSERICQQVLGDMMQRFSGGTLGNTFVLLYFEEAHTLFRQDDKDLNSIYNKLAKEGAKFHISMVYATQSMTTLSPDLLKNTENFVIAHLDDDREVREITRKYAFRDVAEDVQRTMSRGFVRMITLSHRFALPVQVRKFEPTPTNVSPPDRAH